MADVFVPYCGAAPVPGHEAWNLHPPLLAALLGAFIAGSAFVGMSRRRGELAYFATGWLVLALAFVSPLCNVSVALFSARVAQHMILTLVAAPLIVRGLLGPSPARPSIANSFALAAAIVFTACLWFWHSPLAYDETLENNLVYWLMHTTLFGAALTLWVAVFRSHGFVGFFVVSAISAQMALLAALLTFANAPLYAVHEFTTEAWGLSWIGDQQLGGLLMWVPSGLLLLVYSIIALATVLREIESGDMLPYPRLTTVEESNR